jgi:hypothetical protein
VVGGLILAGLCLAVASCDGPPPEPAEFNDRIARNNAKWNAAVLAFKRTMEPQIKGTPVQPAAAQQAYDDLAKELQTVIRASKHMPVPLKSPSGKAYMEKYEDYLSVQDDMMNGEVKKVVAVVGDPKLDNKVKGEQIWKLYWEIEKREKSSREALQQAQNDFAKAHNLTITNAPPPKK